MQQEDKIRELQVFAQQIRVETIRALATLGFGRTGGNMSVTEALAVLYGGIMKIDPQNPGWEERDWCVMSKMCIRDSGSHVDLCGAAGAAAA